MLSPPAGLRSSRSRAMVTRMATATPTATEMATATALRKQKKSPPPPPLSPATSHPHRSRFSGASRFPGRRRHFQTPNPLGTAAQIGSSKEALLDQPVRWWLHRPVELAQLIGQLINGGPPGNAIWSRREAFNEACLRDFGVRERRQPARRPDAELAQAPSSRSDPFLATRLSGPRRIPPRGCRGR